MNELHVFCDESGNTGANFVDPEQPVYVLAGWGAASDAVDGASSCVESSRFRHRIQGELRAKRLFKSQKGCRATAELMTSLGARGCFPLFTIVEKRYAVAAKMVDTYLDHEFNPEAPRLAFTDALGRSELANTLCSLPDATLRRFGAAYRALDVRELEAVAVELGGLQATGVPPEILRAVPGVVPRLPQIAAYEREFRGSQPKDALASLNFPIFMSMLYMVELLARRLSVKAKIYHDSISQFEEAFKSVFVAFGQRREAGQTRLTSGVAIPHAFTHVSEVSILESHEHPLIQAADMLAGLLCEASVCAVRRTQLAQPLAEAAKTIFPLVLFTDDGVGPQFAGLLASNAFLVDIAQLLYPQPP